MIFTTSWDDGYALDIPLADMLARHGMAGTFYVCPQLQHGQVMLTQAEIRALSDRFEIGAHTLTHPRLTAVSDDEARKEIRDSKHWIEETTGKECTMFCYPKGLENARLRQIVREEGYAGARTVEQFRFDVGDPFGMPTSLHVYPFPMRRRYVRWQQVVDPLGPLRVHWSRLRQLDTPLLSMRGFLPLAKALFTNALRRNEKVFHLWGHSEEVRRLGLWDDLSSFLEFVSRHANIEYRTNGGIVASRSS